MTEFYRCAFSTADFDEFLYKNGRFRVFYIMAENIQTTEELVISAKKYAIQSILSEGFSIDYADRFQRTDFHCHTDNTNIGEFRITAEQLNTGVQDNSIIYFCDHC